MENFETENNNNQVYIYLYINNHNQLDFNPHAMEGSRHADWSRQRVEESRVSQKWEADQHGKVPETRGSCSARPARKDTTNTAVQRNSSSDRPRRQETAVSTGQFQDHVPSQKHTRGFWRARFKTQRLILAFFFKLEILKRIQALPATSANENSPQK